MATRPTCTAGARPHGQRAHLAHGHTATRPMFKASTWAIRAQVAHGHTATRPHCQRAQLTHGHGHTAAQPWPATQAQQPRKHTDTRPATGARAHGRMAHTANVHSWHMATAARLSRTHGQRAQLAHGHGHTATRPHGHGQPHIHSRHTAIRPTSHTCTAGTRPHGNTKEKHGGCKQSLVANARKAFECLSSWSPCDKCAKV